MIQYLFETPNHADNKLRRLEIRAAKSTLVVLFQLVPIKAIYQRHVVFFMKLKSMWVE